MFTLSFLLHLHILTPHRAVKTRSGAAFSPWFASIGVPLHAPPGFIFEERVAAAVRNEALHEHHPTRTLDEDSSPHASGSLPHGTCAERTCEEETRTHEAPARRDPSNTHRQADSPSLSKPAPPTDDVSAVGRQFDSTRSKRKFHAAMNKKKARQKAREKAAKEGHTSRAMKDVARKRVKLDPIKLPPSDIIPPRYTSMPSGFAVDDTSSTFATLVTEAGVDLGAPLRSTYDFDGAEKVAGLGFQAPRETPTADELTKFRAADFVEMGFQYVSWDGR